MRETNGPTTRPPREDPSGLDLFLEWLADVVARVTATGRRGIACTVIGALIGVGVALLTHDRYTSVATFIAQGPTTGTLPAALQGLAASVGLDAGKDFSPKFYADLLTSRPVLLAAIHARYQVLPEQSGLRETYIEIEDLDSRDSARATEEALKQFSRAITARVDARTNVITVAVEARYPSLSRDIVDRLLAALDSLNIEFRQHQSKELRRFYEERVQAGQRELDSTEAELRHFLERNRVIANSPLLLFEQARLNRTVEIKRAVYQTVVQQYEQARLQESRNVPVLTVLSPPYLPTRKSGPPRRLIVVLGAVIGFSLLLVYDAIGSLRRIIERDHPDTASTLRLAGRPPANTGMGPLRPPRTG